MKTNFLKRAGTFAAALLMAVSMASCGSPAAAPANSGTDTAPAATPPEAQEAKAITLKVINYHVGTDYAAEYYKMLFEEFPKTELGKGVTFEFEEIPTTDAYNQKLKLLISSGDLPDIVLNGGNNFTELAAKSGKVADLTPYFDADPEWKAQFEAQSLEFNSVDGKIYGVPVSKEISYIYYNKELFEKAGITPPATSFATWDEFFAACDKLKAAGVTPLGMDTADFGWLTNLWYSALIGTSSDAGNKWMNTMHPKDYSTPEVLASTEMLQKMLSTYTTRDAVGGKYDPMATHFFNGEVAMFPNGPWMIPDFKNTEKAPAGFYDKVGVMLLPGDAMEMVPTPGDMVGAKDPDKIAAAVNFLKFETSLENQVKALEMTGLQPVSPKVTIPEALKTEDPLMAQVLDLQGKAKITYGQNQAYWYQNTLDSFSTLLPELANNNMTPADFCAKMSKDAEKNKD